MWVDRFGSYSMEATFAGTPSFAPEVDPAVAALCHRQVQTVTRPCRLRPLLFETPPSTSARWACGA